LDITVCGNTYIFVPCKNFESLNFAQKCRSLKANGVLTVLPADKGNAAMVLGTPDYNQKIAGGQGLCKAKKRPPWIL
jgi:hypothetical protein